MVKRAERKALDVSAKLQSRGLHAFVWTKKIEHDLSRGIQPPITSLSSEKKRCLDRLEKIEKIKKRRSDLVSVSSQFKDKQFVVSKSCARDELPASEREAEFELNQSKIRSEIRLNSGRAKLIDILLQFLCKIGKEKPKLDNPLLIFTGSDLKELEELKEDLELHLAFDKTNSHFWEAINLVCNWEIQKADGVAHGNALQSSKMSSEVTTVIEHKTCSQLEYMQNQIEMKMKSGDAKEVEFWESVLNYVMIFKAKKYLQENYSSSEAIGPKETQPIVPEISRINSYKNEEELISDHGLIKPKYIFRVHTGFQWNKYNRTHYDHDHPPPKTVKGYSFAIYYPNCCGRTPQYSIEKDGNSESCYLRFYAGPPYEDVIFRIVNKEWDLSWKSGFRCTFSGGILRLNFFFRKFSYRR